MIAIDIQHLEKQYPHIMAVQDFSLQVKDGEILSLLGMNGAGKTTVIKMLSCLTKPTSGDAWIYGKSILSAPTAVKSMIGIAPQESSFARNLTVEENLRMMCGIYGISKERTTKNMARIIQQLSLQKVLRQRAGKLSGGWQKRLSIAMALVTEPKLLFLDEPTLGLDVMARRELWHVLEALKGSLTIILTTHYLEESEHLADHIAILKEGQLKAFGTLDELKEQTKQSDLESVFLAVSEALSGGVE